MIFLFKLVLVFGGCILRWWTSVSHCHLWTDSLSCPTGHQPSKGNRGRFPRQPRRLIVPRPNALIRYGLGLNQKQKRQNSDQMEVNIPYMEQSWSIWDFSHSGRSTFRARLDKMSCTNLSYTSHILSIKITLKFATMRYIIISISHKIHVWYICLHSP